MVCWKRMLTNSTAFGEMSMPTHLRPSLSAATQAVAQPQKGSEDDVALLAAGVDDAFEQGQGLLGWVAEAFTPTLGHDNICPKVLQWPTLTFV